MNYVELSKEVSYALRHAPWEYELELDSDGWVAVSQLLDSLQRSSKWADIQVEDLQKMIKVSDKKRHEIVDNKIRAFYGHSIPAKIHKEEKCPPKILYHGTSRRFIESIMNEGLLPKSRQYVHLSQDIKTAKQVGSRVDSNPIILIIHSEKAYQEDVKFYYGHEMVWLADFVPSRFIEILQSSSEEF